MQPDPCHAGHAPARIGRRIAASLLTAACCAARPALAETPASDDDAGAVLRWRWQASSSAMQLAAPFESPRGAPGAAPPIDYRLWFGDRRTEVGIRLATDSTTVLAFRHQVSADSRLTLDALLSSRNDPPTGRARGMALDLGLESSPLHGLAKGNLLRAQLDLRSSVALRLRGGRLGLYLQVRLTGDE